MTNKQQTSKPKFSEWLAGRTLKSGCHPAERIREGEFCALEAVCLYRGVSEFLSDSPAHLGGLDIRNLNDAPWSSNEIRTKHMARVVDAWFGKRLTKKRAGKITLETVRQILPVALRAAGLPEQAEKCAAVKDLKAADAAADKVLILACDIFVEAAGVR